MVNKTKPFVFPDLAVNGMEGIGFPISPSQIKEMMQVAHRASFGKGQETVLDTTVRSAWEIDANNIELRNKDWSVFIDNILEEIAPALGLQDQSVSAHLYKLLIYEKGDFFLKHKDSEKEPKMFGTLIIGLPAIHTGGELTISFGGKSNVVSFSEATNTFQIPYVAFYADCDHEITSVTSGYRVCLVYNLVQNSGAKIINNNSFFSYKQEIASLLDSERNKVTVPKIVLLGHQYTPSNFTMESLKLNDKPKAEVLMEAAEMAGYYCKLGLVTSYQIGEPDQDLHSYGYGRGRYHDDGDYGSQEMGEIHDEYLRIEHWMDEGIPPLLDIAVNESELIAAFKLNENEPTETEFEGYTGNAGMTLEYWYHYGALILWPKEQHYNLLVDQSTSNKLEWIQYFNQRWEKITAEERVMLLRIIEEDFGLESGYSRSNFDAFAELLINLDDEQYLMEKATPLLTVNFCYITVECWKKLFEKYQVHAFVNIFSAVAQSGDHKALDHYLRVLRCLDRDGYTLYVNSQIRSLPVYLNEYDLMGNTRVEVKRAILESILVFGEQLSENQDWIQQIGLAFTKNLTRDYVHQVFAEVLLGMGSSNNLTAFLLERVKLYLIERVESKPLIPDNWIRSLNGLVLSDKRLLFELEVFMKSPTETLFDYKQILAKRNELENALIYQKVDLDMETIRKGSPHTFRLTKNLATYERELMRWKNDRDLLIRLQALV